MSFEIRLAIKEKMKVLDDFDFDHHQCLVEVKRIVMALRYVEDYLIEYQYKKYPESFIDQDFNTLSGEGPHYLINPKFQDFSGPHDLRPGDVILSRGNAYSSAAIAKIGRDDSQFSHISLTHTGADGNIYTSEAHIEIGSVNAPIKTHIDQKNARSVVFRYSDPLLSERASQITAKYVKDYQMQGRNIPYDFGMDYNDASKLFCSEVVYFGFKRAAQELYRLELEIPKHKTHFKRGNIHFLQQIGIAVTNETVEAFSTFGPGDIQFEPQFEIVAEWRNPTKLADTRYKDAILTKIFQWMEEGYRFYPDVLTSSASYLLAKIRKNKLAMDLYERIFDMELDKEFSLHMSPKQIELFLILDKVGENLYHVLLEEEKDRQIPLTPIELFEVLENYRKTDNQKFLFISRNIPRHRKNTKEDRYGRFAPKMHHLFHQ